MQEKKGRFPRELSGGEQQRVSIARAVVKNPKLLLCDEPTGALDYATARSILQLLQLVNRKYGTTILMVTHNTAIADMANRVFKLRSGEIVEDVSTRPPFKRKGLNGNGPAAKNLPDDVGKQSPVPGRFLHGADQQHAAGRHDDGR
jgi:ABC-type methionine transport system ATPase subunit